jgi:hypothetical protein
MAVKDALVREPSTPEVVSSPITDSRLSIPVGPLEAREKWGYVFWGILGTLILLTEALAAFWSGFPIPTISWTTGQIEQNHHWFKLIVVAGITLIAFRITFYPWPFKRLDD